MKTLQLEELELAIPNGWTDFRQGARLVCQSGDVEIIVSAHRVEPLDSTKLDELFEGGIASTQRIAANPELVPSPGERGENTWSLECTSTDNLVYFAQLVCKTRSAVVLLTFESPITEQRRLEFRSIQNAMQHGHHVTLPSPRKEARPP